MDFRWPLTEETNKLMILANKVRQRKGREGTEGKEERRGIERKLNFFSTLTTQKHTVWISSNNILLRRIDPVRAYEDVLQLNSTHVIDFCKFVFARDLIKNIFGVILLIFVLAGI
jgi:hypothetical protein